MTALNADERLYFNEDSGNVAFICNGMGILNIDLNILTMLIMMKMILILLFMSDFWLNIFNLKNVKNTNKS